MGRKTWESIPPRFRPLKGRLNVVISRSFPAPPSSSSPPPDGGAETEPVRAGSLEQALVYLAAQPADSLGRVFVVGGAQIYAAALALPETKRVLLTRVLTDFERDTFFPLALGKDGEGSSSSWVRRSKAEHDAWAGEEVLVGVQEENGAEYEFQMWERVD